jgi:hypothetical protein
MEIFDVGGLTACKKRRGQQCSVQSSKKIIARPFIVLIKAMVKK